MKKICALAVLVALTLGICFPMSVAAASGKYALPELGLEVTVPEDYYVVTRDTPANDPVFDALGLARNELLDQFEASNIYLNAVANSFKTEIVVTMAENIIDNFSLFSDATLDAMAATFVDEYSAYGLYVKDYVIYHHEQAKFIKISFADLVNTTYGLQYYTVYDGKAINFTLRSYEGSISSKQEAVIKAVVDSVRFEKDPPVSEEGEDTDPFSYFDAGSGVTFTVPANWKKEAFSEEREFIDVKFVSTKEDGCGMIFGSVDVWGQMSALERMGYTREEYDNSVFTRSDIAEICGTTADQVFIAIYNGTQYFKCETKNSAEVYGLDVSVTMTHLVCIKNGWLYMFQFSGTSSHELYSDFEMLLDSVKYPAVSKVETAKPSSQGNSNPNQSKQNSSKDSMKIPQVIAVALVLLMIVPGIVIAVVLAYRKNKAATNRPIEPTTNAAPERIPENDALQIRFCRNCGDKLIEGSRFCSKCGTQVVAIVDPFTE